MINAKKLISDFSMPEKIDLFNALYWDISERGTDGDTELAHVNTFEARWLKSMGGSGTINELTGLREYKGGGGSPPPPQPVTTQDITQTAEFPEELKPHISRIAGEAQAEYDAGRAEGFLPFPGPKLAGFRPEQQAAFELGRQQFGTGLAGTGLADPRLYYGEGLESLRTGRGQLGAGTEEITSEEIQGRINPFQQNVIDIAKREARRDEDVARQVRGREAAGAASYGGSRAGVMEAEAGRNLAQQLSDIQERGLYAGYDTASRGLEEERKRQLLGGQQLGGLGAQFATMGEGAADRARRQIAGLAGVGEVQQGQRQQALDLARQQFEQEKFFPKSELQAYQSIIRGFPSAPGQTRVQKEPLIQTPLSTQLLNAGLSGLNLYGNLGGFRRGNTGGQVGSFAGGGIVSLQKAGSLGEAIDDQNWLTGLAKWWAEHGPGGGGKPEGAETLTETRTWPKGTGQGYGSKDYAGGKDPRYEDYDANIPSFTESLKEIGYTPDTVDRYMSTRQPDELQSLIESQTTIGPAGQKYTKMIEEYQKQQKSRPAWTAGLGPAAEESQRLTEEARSARGGLGAFQQPSFLESLTAAANAASGGIGEERTRREAVDYAMAKEAAEAEAAARQQRIDNLIAFKEAGGNLKAFSPSGPQASLIAANYLGDIAGPDFDLEDAASKAVLTNFSAAMHRIASAFHTVPEFSELNDFDKLDEAGKLTALAFDPATNTMDKEVLEILVKSAQLQRTGQIDRGAADGTTIPPLEVIQQMAIVAQQLGQKNGWSEERISNVIRGWITSGDPQAAAKLRELDVEEVGPLPPSYGTP